MDWLKTTLDRLSGFLASLIPGSVVFLLFAMHQPSLIREVWEASFLTYNTKIILGVFFAIAIGHTINFSLTTFMHMLGGGLGGFIAAGPARPDPDVRPWQNKNWRALLSRYLGRAAPENIEPVYKEAFELRLNALQHYEENLRAERAAELLREKAKAGLNDYEWRGWWQHLHRKSLLG